MSEVLKDTKTQKQNKALEYFNETIMYTPSVKAISYYFHIFGSGYASTDSNYFWDRESGILKGYLLIYTLSGKGNIIYRGKQYQLRKGQLFLFDCSEKHTYYTEKNDFWNLKWVIFDGCSSQGYFNMIYEAFGPIIDMNGGNIPNHLDSILNLLKGKDLYFEIKASPIVVQILTEILVTGHSNLSSHAERTNDQNVKAAIKFVEENYMFNITLENLSEAACCSKYHFSRIFKKKTGFSPNEYVIKYRINRAKVLLRTSDLTVEDISSSVGFRSSCFFITTFKTLEGVTPLKYRKSW